VTVERRFCTSAEKRIQTAVQELEYIFYCKKIGYKGTAYKDLFLWWSKIK